MSRRITPSLLNTSLPARTVAVSPYLLRAASSATNPTPTASSSHTSPAQLPLTWPAYLSARRQRRLWSTLTSVPTTLVGLFGGGGYFANMELDPGQMILGMDPMIASVGASFGCMLLGYLVGPTIGSTLFSLTHPALSRGKPSALETMDRELFEHIKRHRVDPKFQSVNNLPPDYYGEKITSLSTYRRWLRDQATYKRKAMHGVPGEAV